MDTDGSAAEGVIFVETTQTDTDTTRIAELLEAGFRAKSPKC